MPDSRLSVQKILGVCCGLMYVAVATIGAFSGSLWAAVAIPMTSILYIGVWIADKKMPRLYSGFAWFTMAALALFGEELLMASDFLLSLNAWMQLTSIFMSLFLLLSPRIQIVSFPSWFLRAVPVAAAIGALALGVELLSGGVLLHSFKKATASLTEYNRGIAHLVILAFPLFAGLWAANKKKEVGLLAVALLFPASLTESHTAKLALLVGGACTAMALYRPMLVTRGLAVGLALLVGWPFYVQYAFNHAYNSVQALHDSFLHRVEIWDYLSYRVMEKPIWGWGLGSTHMLDFSQPHGNLYHMVTQAAPHAHNFVMEMLVETGVAGMAFGMAFFAWALRSAYRLDASLRPFALGGWACAVVVCLFGFDFWTDALWAAFALSAFAFGMLQQQIESKRNLA